MSECVWICRETLSVTLWLVSPRNFKFVPMFRFVRVLRVEPVDSVLTYWGGCVFNDPGQRSKEPSTFAAVRKCIFATFGRIAGSFSHNVLAA